MSHTDMLFFFGCIPLRTAIAYNIKSFSREVTLIPAIGFFIRWLQSDPPGATGFFGSEIWWGDLRMMHSLIWLGAYINFEEADTLLLGDVGIGLLAKLLRYRNVG